MTAYEQKITFGQMRASGVRDVLIYCRDHRRSHHAQTNAYGWADRLSDIEPNFTCTRSGKNGAEIRPKFSQARMGTVCSRFCWIELANEAGYKGCDGKQ